MDDKIHADLKWPDTDDDEAMVELGRQLAVDALLREMFSGATRQDRLSAAPVGTQPRVRRFMAAPYWNRKRLLGACLALATMLLIAMIVWNATSNEDPAQWHVRASEGTRHRKPEPNVIELSVAGASDSFLDIVDEGDVTRVEQLLDEGANVKATNKRGRTALHLAASNGHKEMVKLLLARGADVNAWGRNGGTPLYDASMRDTRIQVASRYASGQDGSRDKSRVVTPPTHNEHVQVMDLLITAGAEVNARTRVGSTPLHIASGDGVEDMVTLLLAHGADVSIRGLGDKTPLHVAAEGGHKAIAELLLAHHAAVDAATDDGDTPLHGACYHGKRDVVELLLAQGASVEARGRRGRTPLHTASQNGDPDIVKMLLMAGADATAADDDGDTPLHHAAYEGNLGAAHEEHLDAAKLLLAKGAQVNAKNADDETPLHGTVVYGNVAMAELLIAGGATPSARNKDGHTALELLDITTLDWKSAPSPAARRESAQRKKRLRELLRRHMD